MALDSNKPKINPKMMLTENFAATKAPICSGVAATPVMELIMTVKKTRLDTMQKTSVNMDSKLKIKPSDEINPILVAIAATTSPLLPPTMLP